MTEINSMLPQEINDWQRTVNECNTCKENQEVLLDREQMEAVLAASSELKRLREIVREIKKGREEYVQSRLSDCN